MIVDWFRKAFMATAGYTTFSCLYAIIILVLGGGCLICVLWALAQGMEGG
jgi:hypothetical protein